MTDDLAQLKITAENFAAMGTCIGISVAPETLLALIARAEAAEAEVERLRGLLKESVTFLEALMQRTRFIGDSAWATESILAFRKKAREALEGGEDD